ncbi:MAG: threo-3-hydroxy-L-aspartate ammonia-lyase [Desulfovibrio sp.]|jgi:threonine dehydratase|nr:threo-3-hydroxy-L-aspartate ammonia-lyase [Desulfovibrio sp.]
MDDTFAVSYDDIVAARGRICGAARRTPVLTSSAADARAGGTLLFKCENFQRMGAFKFRGAFNALSRFTKAQKAAGVVTFSSGNHAQAVALSAKLLGVRAVVVMPGDAPAAKIAATRGYGAEIRFYDRRTEDREALGAQLAAEQGLTLIPPYDHPDVMAGQGTCAVELIEDAGPLDLLLTPLGGGGLLSGCAVAARALCPDCEMYGVEPEAGDDGRQSLRSGRIITTATPQTIADGAQTTHLGRFTFPVIRGLVKDILTVSDEELAQTMRFFAERMKIVVEPTGCLAAAAVFSGRVDIAGRRAGIVLSGGNVDLGKYADLLR